MPQDLLAQGGNDVLAGKDLLAGGSDVPHITIGGPRGANEGSSQKDDTFLGGVERGFMERGTGVDQTLNQMGVGGAVPVFKNGKLSFGLPPNEELAKQAKELEAQGKGTGIKGTVAEMIGDPLNYIPTGKMGMAAAGGIQGALSSLTAPSTKGNQTGTQRLENTALGGATGAGTGHILGALGSKTALGGKPTGEATEASDLYKAANNLGLKLTGKESAKEVWDKVQAAVKDKTSEIAEKASPGSATSQVWPVGVNLATSKMYDATRQAGGVLYDKAKEAGAKLEAPAEGLVKHVDDLIADMEKDAPFQSANPKFGTALKTFRNIRDGLASSGEGAADEKPWDKVMRLMQHGEQPAETIKGDKLIELDQALNEHFGRSGGSGESGKAFAALQNKVNQTIKNMDPAFGAAYQKAKDYWRQNVIQNFEENPVLKKHWEPEDYEAFKAMQKGITLPPALKARVDGMLDKIKSPLALGELKNSLPPEMYDSVRSSKFIQLMDKAGLDAKAIGDDKTYALLTKALEHKPEQLQALDAIKTFVEQMNERGIGAQPTALELKKSDKLLDRSMRTAFSFATGHNLYAIRHALEMVGDKASPTAVQGKLEGLAKEVAGGAPKAVVEPTAAHKIGAKVLETGEGNKIGETSDALRK